MNPILEPLADEVTQAVTVMASASALISGFQARITAGFFEAPFMTPREAWLNDLCLGCGDVKSGEICPQCGRCGQCGHEGIHLDE